MGWLRWSKIVASAAVTVSSGTASVTIHTLHEWLLVTRNAILEKSYAILIEKLYILLGIVFENQRSGLILAHTARCVGPES